MGKYWFKFKVNGYEQETVVDAVGESAAWRLVEDMYRGDRVVYLDGMRADNDYGKKRIEEKHKYEYYR